MHNYSTGRLRVPRLLPCQSGLGWEALRYPLPARSRGLTGTVHLEIFIKPDGAISTVSVTNSSSHPLLDEAALDAVRSLAPQPFPKGLAPRPLRVRLPVVFDLQ